MSRVEGALARLHASGGHTVYLIRRGDGDWTAHVRHPEEGTPPFAMHTASDPAEALSDAIDAAFQQELDPDFSDLV